MILFGRHWSDWLSPMLVKELRQGTRARAFSFTFIGIGIALLLVFSFQCLAYANDPESFDSQSLHAFFWFILGIPLVAAAPLRALAAIANENRARTLELIHLTQLSPFRIALGKWASLFIQSLLFVLAVLPFWTLRYFFGGVNLWEDFIILMQLLAVSAVLTAAGVALSSLHLFFRVILAVHGGIFFLAFGSTGAMAYAVMRTGGGFSTSPSSMDWLLGLLWWACNTIACVVLLLGHTAERTAPVAVNAVWHQRLALLCLCLLALGFSFLMSDSSIHLLGTQVLLALAALAYFTFFDLARTQPLLLPQVRPFHKKDPTRGILAALFLPGWPSALLVLLLGLTLLGCSIASMGYKPSPNFTSEALTLLALVGSALLAPHALLLLFGWNPRNRLLTLFFIHLGIFVLSIFLGLMVTLYDGSRPEMSFALPIPGIGLWAQVFNEFRNPGGMSEWAIASFFTLVLVLLLRSAPFWRRLGQLWREAATSPASEPTTPPAPTP